MTTIDDFLTKPADSLHPRGAGSLEDSPWGARKSSAPWRFFARKRRSANPSPI